MELIPIWNDTAPKGTVMAFETPITAPTSTTEGINRGATPAAMTFLLRRKSTDYHRRSRGRSHAGPAHHDVVAGVGCRGRRGAEGSLGCSAPPLIVGRAGQGRDGDGCSVEDVDREGRGSVKGRYASRLAGVGVGLSESIGGVRSRVVIPRNSGRKQGAGRSLGGVHGRDHGSLLGFLDPHLVSTPIRADLEHPVRDKIDIRSYRGIRYLVCRVTFPCGAESPI